jgi:hypothetical protein
MHRDGADQQVHPVRHRDEEDPHVALMLRPGGHEISGWKSYGQARHRRDQGLADGTAIDGKVGRGEDQCLVQEVALEQKLNVSLGGEFPDDAAISARRQEGIDADETKRRHHENENGQHRRCEQQRAASADASRRAAGTFLHGW